MSVGEMVFNQKVQNFIGYVSLSQKRFGKLTFGQHNVWFKLSFGRKLFADTMFSWWRYNYGPDNTSF